MPRNQAREGPAIAEMTGALIAIVIILSRLKSGTLEITSRGVIILLLSGICVFSVDYFSLRAYSKGLSITMWGVGGFGEVIFAEHSEWVFGALGSFFPDR